MAFYPLIGIMVSNKKARESIFKLYKKHFNLPGKLFIFARSDILWEKKKIIGLYQVGNTLIERYFPFPDAVYNRCYNKSMNTVNRINEIVGSDRCFNCKSWFDKWQVYNLLSKSNLKPHIPDTFLLNRVDIKELLCKYKLMFIKPSYGYLGKNLYRLELKKNEDIYISNQSLAPKFVCRNYEDIRQRLAEILEDEDYIIQQGIYSDKADGQHYDVRVLVQKNIGGSWVISNKVCRVAHELYYNTAVYDSIYEADVFFDRVFTSPDIKKAVNNSIDEISLNAAKAMEKGIGLLGELSVDLVLDEEMNLWIIEINGKPQKKIYQDINQFKNQHLPYQYPLEYAYYLATQNRAEKLKECNNFQFQVRQVNNQFMVSMSSPI